MNMDNKFAMTRNLMQAWMSFREASRLDGMSVDVLISPEEVWQVLSKMMLKRAPGADGIVLEMLLCLTWESIAAIADLYTRIINCDVDFANDQR